MRQECPLPPSSSPHFKTQCSSAKDRKAGALVKLRNMKEHKDLILSEISLTTLRGVGGGRRIG